MDAKRSEISVLIATSNAMAGELLSGALNRQPWIRVVAIATSGADVLKAAQSVHLDVALINPTLTDGPLSGFGTLRQMREISPAVKSVVMLDNPETHLVVDAFRSGAKGVFCPSQSGFKSLWTGFTRGISGPIAMNWQR
jgi:DNA-binding NarL/FixJ family response regulator